MKVTRRQQQRERDLIQQEDKRIFIKTTTQPQPPASVYKTLSSLPAFPFLEWYCHCPSDYTRKRKNKGTAFLSPFLILPKITHPKHLYYCFLGLGEEKVPSLQLGLGGSVDLVKGQRSLHPIVIRRWLYCIIKRVLCFGRFGRRRTDKSPLDPVVRLVGCVRFFLYIFK